MRQNGSLVIHGTRLTKHKRDGRGTLPTTVTSLPARLSQSSLTPAIPRRQANGAVAGKDPPTHAAGGQVEVVGAHSAQKSRDARGVPARHRPPGRGPPAQREPRGGSPSNAAGQQTGTRPAKEAQAFPSATRRREIPDGPAQTMCVLDLVKMALSAGCFKLSRAMADCVLRSARHGCPCSFRHKSLSPSRSNSRASPPNPRQAVMRSF